MFMELVLMVKLRISQQDFQKDTDNTEFKLFGEKGNTIGEFKGFINFDTELTESTLNIPEADFKRFRKRFYYKVDKEFYSKI